MTTPRQRRAQIIWMLPTPAFVEDGIVDSDDDTEQYVRNPLHKLIALVQSEREALIFGTLAVGFLSMSAWIYRDTKPGDPRFDLYLAVAGILFVLVTLRVLHHSVRIEWDDRQKHVVVNRRCLWKWTISRTNSRDVRVLVASLAVKNWPTRRVDSRNRTIVALILDEQCIVVGVYGSIDQAVEACSSLEDNLGLLQYLWNDVNLIGWSGLLLVFLGFYDNRHSVLTRGASPPTRSPRDFLRFENPDAI